MLLSADAIDIALQITFFDGNVHGESGEVTKGQQAI